MKYWRNWWHIFFHLQSIHLCDNITLNKVHNVMQLNQTYAWLTSTSSVYFRLNQVFPLYSWSTRPGVRHHLLVQVCNIPYNFGALESALRPSPKLTLGLFLIKVWLITFFRSFSHKSMTHHIFQVFFCSSPTEAQRSRIWKPDLHFSNEKLTERMRLNCPSSRPTSIPSSINWYLLHWGL